MDISLTFSWVWRLTELRAAAYECPSLSTLAAYGLVLASEPLSCLRSFAIFHPCYLKLHGNMATHAACGECFQHVDKALQFGLFAAAVCEPRSVTVAATRRNHMS